MELSFAELKPSVWNAILFFFMALLTIPLGKMMLAKWHIPGLSELAAAV